MGFRVTFGGGLFFDETTVPLPTTMVADDHGFAREDNNVNNTLRLKIIMAGLRSYKVSTAGVRSLGPGCKGNFQWQECKILGLHFCPKVSETVGDVFERLESGDPS